MNHPAILTLEFEDGSRQYALLRAVDGDNAIIDTANGPLRLPFATLDPLWNSEFLMLWQRPIEESQIDSQTRGDSVLWLRRTWRKPTARR